MLSDFATKTIALRAVAAIAFALIVVISVPANAAGGLGITRDEAVTFFSNLEFVQGVSPLADGRERVLGEADMAMSEVIGPADDVTDVSMMLFITDDNAKNMPNMARMVAYLNFLFPNWEGGIDWAVATMTSGEKEGSMTRNGRTVRLQVIESLSTLSFTTVAAE